MAPVPLEKNSTSFYKEEANYRGSSESFPNAGAHSAALNLASLISILGFSDKTGAALMITLL